MSGGVKIIGGSCSDEAGKTVLYDADGNPITSTQTFDDNALDVSIRSERNYAVQIDEDTTKDLTYLGKSLIGSSTSDPVWQIRLIDTRNSTDGMVITWADGNDDFDNIWDNRTSLTYT